MSKILKKLEEMAGTNCSAIISNSQPLSSTFTKEDIIYLKVSQQAFAHIFKQADKADSEKTTQDKIIPKYDEAHLQLGQHRLICFRLETGILYIAMIPQNHDIQKAQKVIRGALAILRKVVNAASEQQPKV